MINDFVLLRFWARVPDNLIAIEVLLLLLEPWLIVTAERSYSRVRLQGDAVYLHCDSHCAVTDTVHWYQGKYRLTIDYNKYFLVDNNGLVIMNVTSLDGTTYRCKSDTVLLAEHVVTITRMSLTFYFL